MTDPEATIIAAVAAAIITAIPTTAIAYAALLISKNQSDFATKKSQRKIFIEYNKQFSALNEALNRIISGSTEDEEAINSTVQDYLNLCSEEYFSWTEGLVSDKVWANWSAGMIFYLQYESIRNVFRREKARAGESYYGIYSLLNVEKLGIPNSATI